MNRDGENTQVHTKIREERVAVSYHEYLSSPLTSTTSHSGQTERSLKLQSVGQAFRGSQPRTVHQSVKKRVVGRAASGGHCR